MVEQTLERHAALFKTDVGVVIMKKPLGTLYAIVHAGNAKNLSFDHALLKRPLIFGSQ
jgi:hypothetical protein